MAHILIIEDNLTMLKSYSEVLRKEGYEVTTAATGPEGMLAIAKDHVTLVLLDIMLPGGMNGFEVLTQLKRDEKCKHIPVIVMTNLDSEKQTGMELGAADYFIKADMNVSDLLEKIKHHLPQQ